jgi:hypothetical protein
MTSAMPASYSDSDFLLDWMAADVSNQDRPNICRLERLLDRFAVTNNDDRQ